MRRSSLAVFLAAVAGLLSAVSGSSLAAVAAPSNVNVAIVTNLGTIDVALDPEHAPITVKNFLRYVDTKFYDGGTFFRAVPGFVIQGGNKTRESDMAPRITLESPLKTGVRNVDGAIAMARTSDPDSATSEFFLDDGAQSVLDGSDPRSGYAAFGHVTKNIELVRKIARLPAQGQLLLEPVKIIRIHRIP
jgi:peptidyl-prolyl cis-trans isomerase A (cyclophilin A)